MHSDTELLNRIQQLEDALRRERDRAPGCAAAEVKAGTKYLSALERDSDSGTLGAGERVARVLAFPGSVPCADDRTIVMAKMNRSNVPLEPGDELHCPHCRQWHPVTTWHTEGTPYTLTMLYWKCTKGMYFAGTRGHISRHETRRPDRAA